MGMVDVERFTPSFYREMVDLQKSEHEGIEHESITEKHWKLFE